MIDTYKSIGLVVGQHHLVGILRRKPDDCIV